MKQSPDEFEEIPEILAEIGLPERQPLEVSRETVDIGSGQLISAVRWGVLNEQNCAFLHGGGQNAHTWDATILALGRPALAIDLPGHGHSSWRGDQDYGPRRNAEAVARALELWVEHPITLIGMSLGGLTGIVLAASRPDLISRLVLVDITPRAGSRLNSLDQTQQGTVALLSGPARFASFELMAEATSAAAPNRPRDRIVRGVRNNSVQDPDGTWRWRYDSLDRTVGPQGQDWSSLTTDLASLTIPIDLIRGGSSAFVTDDDVARMRSVATVHVEAVDGAGHSVQSDRPVELAQILESILAR